jgi:hypothetical protein
MRSMLVAPGVPSGMPAVMAMRSPGRARPSLIGDDAGAIDHVLEVHRIGRFCTQWMPQTTERRRTVAEVRRERDDGLADGRSRAARIAVEPDEV